MSFINPLGLLALLALPVVAALHLLRERKRKMVVSSLQLWEFLDTDVRGPRTRRLPLTWLLALDLLAAALFGLALAEPRLNLDLPLGRGRHKIILIDVTTSMRAVDSGFTGSSRDTRFLQAQRQALAILQEAGENDVITVIAFGREPSQVGDSRQMDKEKLADSIRNLQVGDTGDASQAFEAALAMGLAAVDRDRPAEFTVLTDGAFSDPTDSGSSWSAPVPLTWHLYGSASENQAVVDLVTSPAGDGKTVVFTRIANYGDRMVGRHVTLLVDGRMVGRASLELPPDSTVPQSWTLTAEQAGSQPSSALTVQLVGEDSLPEDDKATVGLHARGSTRVALVADTPAPVEQALAAAAGASPEAELEILSPDEYKAAEASASTRSSFDLTIFRGFLPEAWPSGLSLVLEPPTGSTSVGLGGKGRREVPADVPVRALVDDPLFSSLDFGGVRWTRAWTVAEVPADFRVVLQAGEIPLALRGEVRSPSEAIGSHPVIVLLADLDRGNFSRHPSFPILIAQLLEEARRSSLPAGILSGEPLPLPDVRGEQTLRIKPPEAQEVTIQSQPIGEWRDTFDPGIYRVQIEGEDGLSRPDQSFVTGVNAGDPAESDIRPQGWALAAQQSDQVPAGGIESVQPGQTVNTTRRGVELAPWLLALAVFILVLEARLAWKPR